MEPVVIDFPPHVLLAVFVLFLAVVAVGAQLVINSLYHWTLKPRKHEDPPPPFFPPF